MRQHYPPTRIKTGAVRGSRQWMLLGAALGIVAALAVNIDTGTIVRTELMSGLPISRSLDNPVQDVEFSHWTIADQDVLYAANRISRGAKDDVPLQIAGRLFGRVAAASRTNDFGQLVRYWYPTQYSDIDDAMKPIRQEALREVCLEYPKSPISNAAYVRELVALGNETRRPECKWILGQPFTYGLGPEAPHTEFAGKAPPGENESTPHTYSQVTLERIEEASRNGLVCDPQNAFFPMMLAYVSYIEYKDGDALRYIDLAAHDVTYNDYSVELSSGWQRLDKALFGRPGATEECLRFGSRIDFRCLDACDSVGQITVWKAVEREHIGRYADGLALRMRIARVGAELLKYNTDGMYLGPRHNLIVLSAQAPGAKYLPRLKNKTGDSGEPDYEHAHRCSSVYLAYLDKHRFAKEAAWYRPIFKAQYKQASQEFFALSQLEDRRTNLEANLVSKLQPDRIRASGYWVVAETTLLVIVGLILGFIGYLCRFTPQRERYWTRAQWGAAIGGCIMAACFLIGSSILYTSANACPLAAAVISAVAVIQLALRRSPFAGTPVAILLHSLCCSACLFIAAGISAMGINNFLDSLRNPGLNDYAPFLANTMPFGLALLIFPAIVLLGVVAAHRVRYLGIPGALFYGTRRIILPMISALLFIWAVNIAVTAGIEKDLRMGIVDSLGVKSDAFLR